MESVSSSPSSSNTCMADAQRLNNAGTHYIEIGNYDKAITSLQNALRKWEDNRIHQATSKSDAIWCACDDCNLDGCISFSEQQHKCLSNQRVHSSSKNNSNSNMGHDVSCCGNKRRRLLHSMHICVATNEDEDRDGAVNTNYKRKTYHHDKTSKSSTYHDAHLGFTYQHPIRIPKTSHNMGSTCFFIILFNLALANHLKIVSNDSERSEESIRNVLYLYELIFEYWSRLKADCSAEREHIIATTSFRFVMIIFNNLSQLYRMMDNPIKQRQCLQNLLSIVMVAVESNTRSASMSRNSSSSSNNNNNNNNRNHCHQTFQQSIDGFLTNAMPPEQCAEAA